jgi:hypothetical protein
MSERFPRMLPEVIAMCSECRRGYISVNWNNTRPTCHACGGLIKPIDPVPNEEPYVRGAFVVAAKEGKVNGAP